MHTECIASFSGILFVNTPQIVTTELNVCVEQYITRNPLILRILPLIQNIYSWEILKSPN